MSVGEAVNIDDVQTPQNTDSGGQLVKPRKPGTFVSGDPRAGRNGGRPPVLREIQTMLDTEHRDVNKMRECFARLRNLAMGEPTIVPYIAHDGVTIELKAELKADARFMALYLAYVIGQPPKAPDENGDVIERLQKMLVNAPPEVLKFIMNELKKG